MKLQKKHATILASYIVQFFDEGNWPLHEKEEDILRRAVGFALYHNLGDCQNTLTLKSNFPGKPLKVARLSVTPEEITTLKCCLFDMGIHDPEIYKIERLVHDKEHQNTAT
jgi:hypothetical protein